MMERIQYIEVTVAEYEEALGAEASECEYLTKGETVRLWADGCVATEHVILSDAVGEDAWSYLTDSDEPYAGFAVLVERTGASREIDWR